MKKEEILSEAKKRLEDFESAESSNRDEAREDIEFSAGNQWEEYALTARKDRPTFTYNRAPQFIKQITGDIRQNKPAIKVRPVDDKSDPEVAEIIQGIIRNIENNSVASEAYGTAADNQVTCGEGYLRVYTEWEDDDTFNQCIKISSIKNIFSVAIDPNAKKKTRSDARWAIVSERISQKEFKSRYPGAKVSSYEGTDADMFSWFSGETVRIAEYFYIKEETRLIALLVDGQTIDITDIENPVDGIVRTRKVKAKKVYRCVLSGAEVLEGPAEFPSKYIPIVMVPGEEFYLGDKIYRYGIIRFFKDAQRAFNYSKSAEIEAVAMQPKAPYVVHTKAITGFEQYWNASNTSNLPYLPYDYDKHPSGPQRQFPPALSQGWMSISAQSSDDMKSTTGIYDASLGNRSNETSGKAIAFRDQQSNTVTYIYHSNLALAIQHVGTIIVDMIPKVYDAQRVVRILGEDDQEDMAVINQLLPSGDVRNDIRVGKYDVVVSMGASYATKRMEAAESMLQATQANPGLWNVIGDLIAKNWDFPGSEEIASRLKKTLPPNLVEPEDGDKEAYYMQIIQGLQQQLEQLQQQPDYIEKMAKAEKTKADAENTQADTDGKMLDNSQKQLELASQIGGIEDIIRQTVQQTVMQTLANIQQ